MNNRYWYEKDPSQNRVLKVIIVQTSKYCDNPKGTSFNNNASFDEMMRYYRASRFHFCAVARNEQNNKRENQQNS
jgi:hypothetical protein